nr:uncharacterized protein LOC104646426 [Solanum lycopersicum]
MSFFGRLNYISRFIAQSTVVCEPIFKLLKKDAPTNWTKECQTAFNAIKNYISNPSKLCKRFRKIEFGHTPRIQNVLADALATVTSMIKHPDTDYIIILDIQLKEHPVHYSHVEAEPDGLHDATSNQKRSIRRMTLNLFVSGEVLYRRTPDLGLLRCVDVVEAAKLIEQIHVGVCDTHMNGLALARKILRAGLGVPKSIITDNDANLNIHFMRDICEQFKITHRNSTDYLPQMNGVVEAANKNIKKILRKMIDNHRVYKTKAVLPAEIIQEAELSNAKWVSKRINQLILIDEKRMVVVCHDQLYRHRMVRALHKRFRARIFEIGELVLKYIFLIKTSTKENSHQIGKVLTWFAKYYLEVLWCCWRWMAPRGQNQSTQMLSRDTTCEASVCISVIYL